MNTIARFGKWRRESARRRRRQKLVARAKVYAGQAYEYLQDVEADMREIHAIDIEILDEIDTEEKGAEFARLTGQYHESALDPRPSTPGSLLYQLETEIHQPRLEELESEERERELGCEYGDPHLVGDHGAALAAYEQEIERKR